MATRTETVNLTEEDIEAAIQDWLAAKYGDKPFSITLLHRDIYDDSTVYSAKAIRELP